MAIKALKWLAIVVVVALGLLAALYAALPVVAAQALPGYLERFGVTDVQIDLDRPGLRGVAIRTLQLRRDHIEVTLAQAQVRYDLASLLAGRVLEVSIGNLGVGIGRSDAPPLLEVPPLWTLVPADRIEVRRLALSMVSPDVRFEGRVAFDEHRAEIDCTLESAQLPTALHVRAQVAREGPLDVTLATPAKVELVALRGVPDGRGRIGIDGRLDFTEQPLALLGSLLGVGALQGRVTGHIAGDAPWPLVADAPLRGVALSGELEVALDGGIAPWVDFTTESRVTAVLRDAAIDVNAAPGGRLVVSRLAAGGFEAKRLAITLGEPFEARVGADGTVTVSAVADVSALPAIAWSTSRLSFGAEDTVRIAAEARTSLTADDPLGALTGRARIDANLAMTQEGAALPVAWAEWRGSADIAWSAMRFDVTVGKDASLSLGDVASPMEGVTVPAIDLTLQAPLTVALEAQAGAVDVAASRIGWAVPELGVEGQRVSIRRGIVDLEAATWRRGVLEASFEAATRTGKDALPATIAVQVDTERGRGTFEVAVQGAVTRPLLATQLQGWRSAWDLDRGTIDFRVRGSWAPGAEGASVSAAGRLALAGAGAHAGDITITGMGMDLPFALTPAGVTAGPAPVQVNTVDAGVPLHDLAGSVEVTPVALVLRDVSVAVLGGRVSAVAVDYPRTGGASEFHVGLDGLSLSEVLALEGEDFAGEGVLDGVLPVRIDGGAITMAGGRIVARSPGGRIRYRGTVSSAARSTPGLGLALEALADFSYSRLEADADYAADGELDLRVRLEGRNPTVEQGRPIHFNLNVSENVLTLLRTLRVSGEVTERVQEKFSR